MTSKCKWHLCQNQTEKSFCSHPCANKHGASKRRGLIRLMAFFYKGKKCMACGYNKHRGAMQYHHLIPSEKDFTIGSGDTRSWDLIRNELDKCILLCANCHAEYHGGVLDLTEALSRNPSIEDGLLALANLREDVVNTPDEHFLVFLNTEQPTNFCVICNCEIKPKAKKCNTCHNNTRPNKIQWPTRDVILGLLSSQPMTHVASTLGVSSNAVKRYLEKTGAPDHDTGTKD